MTHPTPPGAPRPDDPAAVGPAPTDADVRLLAQLDGALARVAPPTGLADAVLAATRDLLPVRADGLTPLEAQLDSALGPAAAPAKLADAVLNATRDHLPAAADHLADAGPGRFVDVAPDHLAGISTVGRIGFRRAGWMGAWAAAAALVALAAGAWWLGPAGDGPSAPTVVATDTPASTSPSDAPVQAAGVDSADLDADAARLLEPFEAVDRRLSRVVLADADAADPVELLGQRLAAVADAGPWAGSGFDGIDRAVDWEVSFENADDGAWLF